ncbi:hypothetical protein GWI33_016477 [Rhynchophorus ferrugineus]|uniref:Uncharacterized protein n=1 Tax=Rhynchophorus ferrugineus TaxID=354439 RepID=A0A834M732_RHYFE|nr:hypothetical protein GWI33_016477 [Rhynchophorus ferrugineus]
MSGKDTSSLRLKKRRRPTEISKSTRDTESEETRLFLSWLSKYYVDFSAGALPVVEEFLIEDNGDATFLNSQPQAARDSQDKLRVFYDPKTLTVKKLNCMLKNINLNVFRALQKTIKHCSYLNVLQLDFCDLSREQVEVLEETLKLQSSMRYLSLRGNPRCRDNAYLLVNVGLKVLNLRMCQIDQHALKKVSDAFLSSSPDAGLLHLDLSSNQLFDGSCKYIASILRCDRGLLSLNVSDCKITDNGLAEILECFRRFELRDEELFLRRKLRLEYYGMLYGSGITYRTDIEQLIKTHPFTSAVESEDGKLYCAGNNKLENLNLAYNALTDGGIDLVMKLLFESTAETRLTRIGLEGNGEGLDAKKSVGDLLRISRGRQSAASVRSKGSLRRKVSSGRNLTSSLGTGAN